MEGIVSAHHDVLRSSATPVHAARRKRMQAWEHTQRRVARPVTFRKVVAHVLLVALAALLGSPLGFSFFSHLCAHPVPAPAHEKCQNGNTASATTLDTEPLCTAVTSRGRLTADMPRMCISMQKMSVEQASDVRAVSTPALARHSWFLLTSPLQWRPQASQAACLPRKSMACRATAACPSPWHPA